MKFITHHRSPSGLFAFALLSVLSLATTPTHAQDLVLDWNNLLSEVVIANEVNENPGYTTRAMAMMNLAIYDGISANSGSSTERPFFRQRGGRDFHRMHTSNTAEVAAVQGAYTVLSSLYSDQQATLDTFLATSLAPYGSNPGTTTGLEIGTEIGEAIIAARVNDGWDAVVEYNYTDAVGHFQADPENPEVPVWGPAWGQVDTFAISSAADYLPASYPDLTSAEYAASYNETKELGSIDSTVRTADQTEAGIFWAYDRGGLGTPIKLFSDVIETIAVQKGNTTEENAELFARASVAMADTAIVAWKAKFEYDFWRPGTAIVAGELDGNPLTEGDENWVALGAPDGEGDIVGLTPQFPTYISGHATFGGALFTTLQEFYGTDDIAFELASQELAVLLDDPVLQAAYGLDLDDATRSFTSLSEAAAENGRSRVYLGIHFDFDDLVGQETGQGVGQAVASIIASDIFAAREVAVTVLGDVNLDGVVSLLDISPFISVLWTGGFQVEADIDLSGTVNFLDISPFIVILNGQ